MILLPDILSSRVRAEIFRLLFGVAAQELHVRELERRSGLTIGTVQQEQSAPDHYSMLATVNVKVWAGGASRPGRVRRTVTL